MRWTGLVVALCVCALLLPGCNRKARARRNLATNQARPVIVDTGPAVVSTIGKVSVALHNGPEGKEPSEIVAVRVMRGTDSIGETTVGSGEAWAPGSVRALEIPLTPAPPENDARKLRLEVTKSTPDGQPGRPWTVQVEALGQLADGRVVRLMELSPSMALGGRQPFRRSWPLAVR
jgi:hypothetical protein